MAPTPQASKTQRRTQPDAAPSRPRGSGSQIVYDRLRKSILELTLAPGSPLDEASLSEQFGMSRTPVREALVRRLYYSSFDDRLPEQYVVEHDEIVAAIEAGDAATGARLAAEHAAQIIRQIQSYLARNSIADLVLDLSDR